ncbi:MAG: nucleotidyltransferase domain-containing protein [Thermodesulfobacteriota bacterium]
MKVFWLNREEIISTLIKSAGGLIVARDDVKGVFLFGSLAEERAIPGSDADILIVLKSSEKRLLDRPVEFYKYFENAGIAVDLFCYTEEEVESIPIAKKAMQNGLCLS